MFIPFIDEGDDYADLVTRFPEGCRHVPTQVGITTGSA
jgi:hypothetical protein